MKISEMTTNQAADALVKVMEPVCNIIKDPDAVPMLQGLTSISSMEGLTGALMKVVPYCLEKHRADAWKILSALTGKTVNKIEKQSILVTMADIRDSIDKDLIDFFKSSAGVTAPSGDESPSA